MKVGFIGLGAMGRPMAKRIKAAGLDPRVHDVVAEAVKEMTDPGAAANAAPMVVAAASDNHCTSLPNPAMIYDV